MSEEQFQSWLATYQAASNSLVNRPDMLQRSFVHIVAPQADEFAPLCRVAEEIEIRMDLLGAVGIEDELQVLPFGLFLL